MTTTRTIELFDILDLIYCAETYRHTNEVCISTLVKWAGPVTDADIDAYINSALSSDPYTQEDKDEAKKVLTYFFAKYQGTRGEIDNA
jgi:hypothetical protein